MPVGTASDRGFRNSDWCSRCVVRNQLTVVKQQLTGVQQQLPMLFFQPSVYDLPGALSTLLCYRDLGVTQGREVLRASARIFLNERNSPPLLLHPEGATTSGNLALMKYGTWAFELNGSVLVAGLHVWRLPLLPVAPSVLGASWAADLCFMLFSPVTLFTIRYIGKLERGESETVEEFAGRVQIATAVALGVKTSNHTVADKVEYMKRLAREAAAAANPMLNPEVHRMAQQVQEVLPHISLEQIKRDLVHTQNVDLTITNFLEGNVPEPTPESRPITPSQAHPGPSVQLLETGSSTPVINQSQSPSHISNISKTTSKCDSPPGGISKPSVALSTAAKSFGKSASERMTSFESRKAQLIENARRKYIEKHGLQVPGYNC
nr:lipid droplet-regulating VLDL assembly factor AUP1-like [Cherax quadricarinatus]